MTTDGIFGLSILGAHHYIVLMPSLTKQFFLQRPSVLSGDDFLHWIHDKYFGDGGTSKRLPADDFHTVHRTLNSLMKEPFLSTASITTVKLLEQRTSLLVSFSSDLSQQLHWEKAGGARVCGDSVEVDLFKLIMYYVGDLAGEVLMGKAFFENNKNILEDIFAFDSGFNALLTGVPLITPGLSRSKAARTRLISAFNEWNHAVASQMKGEDTAYKWNDLSDVSETMRIRTKALDSISASDPFSVASNIAIYWGLMVNSNKIIFWMLHSLISSLKLLNIVREEISPYAKIAKGDGLKLDLDGLIKNCSVFKASFFESMRLYTAGTSYKKVLQDVILTESAEDAAILRKPTPQTYRIAAGNFLVIPHGTMQTDPRLWEDPAKFDPERFLVVDEKNPSKICADVKHLNAFGGGYSVCKGRYFAEREVMAFVAAILTLWDFEAVGRDWGLPLAKGYNGTGSANPKGEVRVLVRKRV